MQKKISDKRSLLIKCLEILLYQKNLTFLSMPFIFSNRHYFLHKGVFLIIVFSKTLEQLLEIIDLIYNVII